MSSEEVIYEVNLKVSIEVLDTFLPWLHNHIQEMLTFDGFLASELLTVEEDVASNDGSIKPFTVQYRLQNRAKLESYFQDHAAAMREDGMKRFGGKFTATRRILAVSQKFSS